jgi:hypothetical protein
MRSPLTARKGLSLRAVFGQTIVYPQLEHVQITTGALAPEYEGCISAPHLGHFKLFPFLLVRP